MPDPFSRPNKLPNRRRRLWEMAMSGPKPKLGYDVEAAAAWMRLPFYEHFLSHLRTEADRPIDAVQQHGALIAAAARSNTYKELLRWLETIQRQVESRNAG